MVGLYIHIPFCNQVCPYCDFYKMVASTKLKSTLINALLEEMKLKKLNNYTFNTLYIGGGTPSSLDICLLDKLLGGISKYVDLQQLEEFTIEVNPSDITNELVELLVKYNVSRISIGVQTFNSKLQKIINRIFDYKVLEEKIHLLRTNNINNINLDLIYAIPSETIDDVISDLNKAISLNPTHLSVYSLILEEHTIFYHQYLKGKLKLISEEEESLMYKHVCDTLKDNNFIHYETSNFSKSGYESKHNLIYWNCDEYIGIGPAASSYINNYRITNINNLNQYLEYIYKNKESYLEKEYISDDESMKEYIMLGLRKVKGISKLSFKNKYKIDIKKQFPKIIELINEGSLIETDEQIYIREDLFYISNHFIAKIIY